MIEVAERPSPGVNLIGFLRAESGLGEIARRLVGALERTDIPFVAIDYGGTPSRQEHPLPFETTTSAPYDTNLICLNADEFPALVDDVGLELFAGRYTIGFWFWETTVFRLRDRSALLYVDEIWAPSEYVRDAVRREADVPVFVAPVPAALPAASALSRTEIGLPEGFVFLFLFDFVSADRKNPLAVVEAFTRAFASSEGPVLVVKSINGRERKPARLAELKAAAAGRRDILVLDGYVSPTERDAFVASCDCFVSLHRSEGFGLPLLEAMTLGKPVVATGYSGNLDYMSEETSYLVPYRLVDVPSSWWAYSPGAQWAEPDVEAAAALMRRVFDNAGEARERGQRGRDDVLDRQSIDRAAAFLRTRLAEAGHASRAGGGMMERILASSHALQGDIGLALTRSSGNRIASALRRLLVRALWPELVEQRRFQQMTLEKLAALVRLQRLLDERLRELEEKAAKRPSDRPSG